MSKKKSVHPIGKWHGYNYHPESWSAQAREMADIQFGYWKEIQEHPELERMEYAHDGRLDENFEYVKLSNASIAYYVDFFNCSYRHPLIRHRAAKRFGRLVRKYLH